MEDERVTGDGARVELDAEDAFAAIHRGPVALVALDYHVAAHRYAPYATNATW